MMQAAGLGIKEIEFLECSNSSTIVNTEIVPDHNTTIWLDCMLVLNPSVSHWVFGCRANRVSRQVGMISFSKNDNFRTRWAYAYTDVDSSSLRFADGVRRQISNIAAPNTLVCSGVGSLTAAWTSFTGAVPIGLFSAFSPAQDISYPGDRIYAAKLYDSNTLVRDFIPVRVGSVGYLYDRVTQQLFGNAGTGAFVLGPDK